MQTQNIMAYRSKNKKAPKPKMAVASSRVDKYFKPKALPRKEPKLTGKKKDKPGHVQNFQGFKMASCVYRKEVDKECYSPVKYYMEVKASPHKDEPFCSCCLLKPCFVLMKNKEINEQWRSLWLRNMRTHGFMYLPEEHINRILNKEMKEEVMMGVFQNIFTKKYAKMVGVPQCAVRSVDRANPCTRPPVGEWYPSSADEAWDWLNRDDPSSSSESDCSSNDSDCSTDEEEFND